MKQDFNIPEFHENRLNEKIPGIPKERNYIAQKISPDKPVIFTIDMGDIFSDMVEREWQEKVFGYIREHREANFLLLSKRPMFYLGKDIPKENTFIGTSLDFAHNYKRIEPIREMGKRGFRTFVNIEPLMSFMTDVDFSGIDFVVVGALTGQKYRPDARWHRSINHQKIHYKRNYTIYFPELQRNKD
jgi:protein gp37